MAEPIHTIIQIYGLALSPIRWIVSKLFRKKEIEDYIRDSSFYETIESKIFFGDLPEIDLKALETFLHTDIVIEVLAKLYRPSEKFPISHLDIEKEFVQIFQSNHPIQNYSNDRNAKIIFSLVKTVCDAEVNKKIVDSDLSSLQYRLEKQHKETMAIEEENLKTLQKIEESIPQTSSLPTIDEGKYLENIHHYIENLLVSNELSRFSYYMELTTIIEEINPISDNKDTIENSAILKSNLSQLAQKENKIILSGEAGSGKTTSLKWLAIQFANNYYQNKTGRIPIYLKLNNYSNDPFENYICKKVNSQGLKTEIFNFLLDKNRLVILIDGLDLISENKQIITFLSSHTAQYILSSRPGTFKEFSSGYKVASLVPLSSEKIDLFINESLADDPTLAHQLQTEIQQSSDLLGLCQNPLILYLTIFIAKKRKKNEVSNPLPKTRSELFMEFITRMFDHLEGKSGKLPIPKQEIIDQCSDIAFKFQTKNTTSMSVSDILDILERYLNEHQKRFDLSANKFFYYIKSTGILTEKADKVEFSIHQSFQEYFSALKLVECLRNRKNITPIFCHPKWQNVIIFVSEIIENPDEFVKTIIDSGQLELASKCCSRTSDSIKNELIKKLKEKLLSSRSGIEKNQAINNLINLDHSIEPFILELSQDKNYHNRIIAVSGLGRIKTDESADALEKALADENFMVHLGAIQSLQQIGTPKAVEILIKSLRHKNPGIRSQAAFCLGWLKAENAVEELIKLLDDEELFVKIGAIEALKIIKPESAIVACERIYKNPNSDLRCRATEALGEIKPNQSTELLILALKDENQTIRWSAAQALGKTLSEQAVDSLLIALDDENFHVRKSARDALLSILNSNSAKQDEILSTIGNPVARIWLQLKLKKIDLDAAEDSFKEILNSKRYDNFQYALEIIKEIESDKLIPSFIEALNDQNIQIQKIAAEALENKKPDLSFKKYLKWLENENLEVRKMAVYAIRDFYSHRKWNNYLKSLEECKKNFDLDSEISDRIGNALIELYKIDERHLRCEIIHILGDLGSEKGIDKLIEIAKDKKSDCRSSSLLELKKIESDRVKNVLLEILEEGNDASMVIWLSPSLGSIFSEKHLVRLTKLSESRNYFLSQFAFNEISKITTESNSKKQFFSK